MQQEQNTNSNFFGLSSEELDQAAKSYYDSLAESLNNHDDSYETGYEGWSGEDLMAMLF